MENVEKFILEQKERLWNDKKKLGLNKSHETDEIVLNAWTSNNNNESKYEREKEKEKLINTLSKPVDHDSIDIQQIIEPRFKNMVKFGEYSPLNPNFRNADKPILGLGEYEERRRMLLEHKKREYFEHIAQLKHGGIPMLLQSEMEESSKVFNKEVSKFVDKAVQVDLLIDTNYNEYKNTNQSSSKYINEWVQATEAAVDNSVLSENIQDFEAPVSEKQSSLVIENNEAPVSSQELVKETESNILSPRPSHINRDIDLSTLSPRLRKLVEFYGVDGYVPSFPETPSPRGDLLKNITSYQITEPAVTQRRQLAYKEELRKQIEEKKRLEYERKEKERQQDEAILRRVIQQQERMQLEYEKEQAQRRSRMEKEAEIQVQSKPSYFKSDKNCGQSVTEKNEEPAKNFKEFCDISVAPKIKKSSPSSICEIDVLSKPLINPTKSQSPISHKTILSDRNLSISPADSTNTLLSENIQKPLDAVKEKYDELLPSDSAENDVCQVQGMKKKRPVPTPRKSLLKKSDVINSNQSCDVLNKSEDQNSPLNSPSINLHDSLPIPVLQAQTANETFMESDLPLQVTSYYSKDMSRTDDKWKVPVVQKNFIHTGNFPNTDKILTQLGAIRRQMQLDHLKFEERLRQLKKNSS